MGTTDFGIEVAKSSFVIARNRDEPIVKIEVSGNENIYEKLQIQHGSDGIYSCWSPPMFYLDCYRLKRFPIVGENGDASYHLKLPPPDHDKYDLSYEIAIYWEEHFRVHDVAIQLTENVRILVTGIVDLMGVMMPFRVEWDKTA